MHTCTTIHEQATRGPQRATEHTEATEHKRPQRVALRTTSLPIYCPINYPIYYPINDLV